MIALEIIYYRLLRYVKHVKHHTKRYVKQLWGPVNKDEGRRREKDWIWKRMERMSLLVGFLGSKTQTGTM